MTLLTMIMKMSEGLGKTCAIFFLTILFSLPLGMLITLLRMSKNKVVSSVTRFVIAVLRGTPLMLQLLAVTYGPVSYTHLDVYKRQRQHTAAVTAQPRQTVRGMRRDLRMTISLMTKPSAAPRTVSSRNGASCAR